MESLKAFLILSVLSGIHCIMVDVKGNQSYQRRFMWNEMENSMGDLMDGVYTGAKQMKQVFGGMLPSLHSPGKTYQSVSSSPYQGTLPPSLIGYKKSNDIMPTTTVRVKYIVRKPMLTSHTSVHYRYPKNFFQLMNANKKPLELPSHNLNKVEKPIPVNSDKPKIDNKTHVSSDLQNHKVENQAYQKISKPSYHHKMKSLADKEPWKPIYHNNHPVEPVATIKPVAYQGLHTSIISEYLPEPERQISHPPLSVKGHQAYEVTENYEEYNDPQSLDDYDTHNPEESKHTKQTQYINISPKDHFYGQEETYEEIVSEFNPFSENENYPKKSKSFKRFPSKNSKRNLPVSSSHNTQTIASSMDIAKSNNERDHLSEWKPIGKTSKYSPNPPLISKNNFKNLASNVSETYHFIESKPKFLEWKAPLELEVYEEPTNITSTENYPPGFYISNHDSESQQSEIQTSSTKAPSSRKAAFYKLREIRQRGSVKFKEKDLDSQ